MLLSSLTSIRMPSRGFVLDVFVQQNEPKTSISVGLHIKLMISFFFTGDNSTPTGSQQKRACCDWEGQEEKNGFSDSVTCCEIKRTRSLLETTICKAFNMGLYLYLPKRCH